VADGVEMGAAVPSLTLAEATPSDADGLTIEGWTLGVHGGPGGVLFGFGDSGWGTPSLVLSNSWGFLWLAAGSTGDSLKIQYPRVLWDDCCTNTSPPEFVASQTGLFLNDRSRLQGTT
jgi:hypothetical protein